MGDEASSCLCMVWVSAENACRYFSVGEHVLAGSGSGHHRRHSSCMPENQIKKLSRSQP